MKSESEIQERLDDLEMQHLNLTARGRMSGPGYDLLMKIGELKWVLDGAMAAELSSQRDEPAQDFEEVAAELRI